MPTISLKNRGTGPRAVIDIKGVAWTLPVDPNRDFEPVEVEVDDITHEVLTEGSEAGGDLEVSGGAAPLSAAAAKRKREEDKRREQQEERNETPERARMQTRE